MKGDRHFYTWFETVWTRVLQRFTVEKINGLCELSNFITCPNQTLSLMFDRIMIKYFKIKNSDLYKNCCWPCQGSFNALKEYQQPLSDIKLQQMLPNHNKYRRQLVIHSDRALIKPCCRLSVKWIPATESWLWSSLHAQSLIATCDTLRWLKTQLIFLQQLTTLMQNYTDLQKLEGRFTRKPKIL